MWLINVYCYFQYDEIFYHDDVRQMRSCTDVATMTDSLCFLPYYQFVFPPNQLTFSMWFYFHCVHVIFRHKSEEIPSVSRIWNPETKYLISMKQAWLFRIALKKKKNVYFLVAKLRLNSPNINVGVTPWEKSSVTDVWILKFKYKGPMFISELEMQSWHLYWEEKMSEGRAISNEEPSY